MDGAIIYKGIFWWMNGLFACRKVRSDENGTPLEPVEFTAKNGENSNHKTECQRLRSPPVAETGNRDWRRGRKSRGTARITRELFRAPREVELPRRDTEGRPYNYYPCDRVEVKRNKATVYLNPQLNREDVLAQIDKEFGLEGLSCVSVKKRRLGAGLGAGG